MMGCTAPEAVTGSVKTGAVFVEGGWWPRRFLLIPVVDGRVAVVSTGSRGARGRGECACKARAIRH